MNLQEKQLVWKRTGYKPNPLQLPIHACEDRIILVAGGERGGKSRVGSADLSAQSLDGTLFWIVGPDYEQARPEFIYVLEDLQRFDAITSVSMPRQGPCSLVMRSGTTIVTKTGEEAIKLASFAPDGILMTEAAQHPFQNFQKLSGRIAEKRGWLLATGTFESSLGWYADMFTALQSPLNIWEGKSFSLPTWSNTAIFPEGENDPEILRLKATYEEEEFLERFGGIPCPPAGVVFKKFQFVKHVRPIEFADVKEPQITADVVRIPFDTELELWVDPGYAGAYAVLFVAVVGGMVFIVDEIYAKGAVAEQVILVAMSRTELWSRVRMTQRRRGSAGVIDIAGRQHQGLESHEEIWRRIAGTILRSQAVPIPDGISRHRTFLEDPFTLVPRVYHDPKCIGTIAEYGKYRYRKETDTRNVSELPIDKDNHSMKALAYGLVDHFGFVDRESSRERRRDSQVGEMEAYIDKTFDSVQNRDNDEGWLG